MASVSVDSDDGHDDVPMPQSDPPSPSSPATQKQRATQSDAVSTARINLGGTIGGSNGKDDTTYAYALLDGLHEEETASGSGEGGGGAENNGQDEEPTKMERVTIPINHLPMYMGRSHSSVNNDPSFFGLGNRKAISRRHVCIYYRDEDGGRVEWDPKARVETDDNGDEVARGQLVYVPPEKVRRHVGEEGMEPERLNHNNSGHDGQDGDGQSDLSARGFFALECLGKNRVIVDSQRVEQGHSIVLRQGSSIRISSYCFYFLLPTDATSTPYTISSTATGHTKKKGTSDGKKRPPSSPGTDLSHNKKIKYSNEGSAEGVGGSGTTMNAYQKELDEMTIEELLSRFDEAMNNDTWDRRTQLLGSSICMNAVIDAGRSMKDVAVKENYSLSRKEIVDWIASSERYSDWVVSMHEKMESRSYISSITRCLLRAGYERNSATGRYIRWIVPQKILPRTDNNPSTPDSGTPTKMAESPPAKKGESRKKESAGSGGGESADKEASSPSPSSDGHKHSKPDSKTTTTTTSPSIETKVQNMSNGQDDSSSPDPNSAAVSVSLKVKQEMIDQNSKRDGPGVGANTKSSSADDGDNSEGDADDPKAAEDDDDHDEEEQEEGDDDDAQSEPEHSSSPKTL